MPPSDWLRRDHQSRDATRFAWSAQVRKECGGEQRQPALHREAGLEHSEERDWLGGLLPLAKLGRKNTCKKLIEMVGCRCRLIQLSLSMCGKLKWTELLGKSKIRDPASVSMFFGFLFFLLSI